MKATGCGNCQGSSSDNTIRPKRETVGTSTEKATRREVEV